MTPPRKPWTLLIQVIGSDWIQAFGLFLKASLLVFAAGCLCGLGVAGCRMVSGWP